jgi:HPt (histidine-containing phosphotransfer) domain-containing protein
VDPRPRLGLDIEGGELVADKRPLAIDRQVLVELLDATGGERGFLAELIDAFLADAPDLVGQMRDAVHRGSAADLVRPVHTLKSSSASLGAMTLSAHCKALESAARAGSLDGAAEAVDTIAAELERASAALATERDASG